MRPEINKLLDTGMKPKSVAKFLGISIHTVYYNKRINEKSKERMAGL